MGRWVCVPDDSLPPLAWLLLEALRAISVGIACGGVESLIASAIIPASGPSVKSASRALVRGY